MKRILPALKLFLLAWQTTIAQDALVSGRVTGGDDGEPLIGATVTIKGTTTGVISGIEGDFEISASKKDILVFSYVGYASEEVAVGAQSIINVSLPLDIQNLEEIMVIGYGEVQKKDLTMAVSSIDLGEVKRKPITSVEQAMQGKAAGVVVTQPSGKPGSRLSVRVRGSTSIRARNEPLYVVDGIPLSNEVNAATGDNTETVNLNPLAGINPADIESIEVLKDASAAAIYGARAANGVVIITTKRGTRGTSSISFNASSGFSEAITKLDVLDGEQYANLINEQFANNNQAPRLDADSIKTLTDWQEEIFRRASIRNYQLSASGGSDRTKYYVSGSYTLNEGIIETSEFERYAFKLNLDQTVNDWINLGTSINYSRSNEVDVNDNQRINQGGVILGALNTPEFLETFNPDGTFTQNPLQAWENPMASLLGAENNTVSNRLLSNFFVDFEILENLSFKSSFGLEVNSNRFNSFTDPFLTQFARSQGGFAESRSWEDLIWLNENIVTYQKNIDKHFFTITAGQSWQSARSEWFGSQVRGFEDSKVKELDAAAQVNWVGTDVAEWSISSYLARGSYNFDDKYLVTINGRVDGSSKFGPNNRYAFFPSASLGWRISEESFFNNVSFVQDLKLRVGYGQTGNQDIPPYSYIGLIDIGQNNYPIDQIQGGAVISSIPNFDLRWETTTQTNIGIDAVLLDSRISFTGELYFKNTSDLLIDKELPESSGFRFGTVNAGSIKNHGVELTFNTVNVAKKDFTWESDLNFSINRNEVVDIGGTPFFVGQIPERGFASIVQEGETLGSFYGFVVDRIYDSEEEIQADNARAQELFLQGSVDKQFYQNSATSPGDIRFKDLNGDGIVTEDDRQVIGSAQPDFSYGFTNVLSYKDFTLDIFFQGVSGNEIFNGSRIETEGMFDVKNALTTTLNRWQQPGDETDMPRAIFGDVPQNSRISDRFIEDGSFLRLKRVTLTYNLPRKILEKIRVSNLSVYASGQNLATWTNYSGYDPEVSRDGLSATSLGIDYGTFPQTRTIILGLNLEF